MADSTVTDINVSKMKVVDLRKELKTRGLDYTGDKAELTARLQAALVEDSKGEHGDVTLDSDELDSDCAFDEDEKTHLDILDDTDNLHEDLTLDEKSPPSPLPQTPEVKPIESKPPRTLKRKITTEAAKETKSSESKDSGPKKIVLNRATSITSAPVVPEVAEKTEPKPTKVDTISDVSKVKTTAELDLKTRLELRAKRFGLPVKISESDRKEARRQRFNITTGASTTGGTSDTPVLTDNVDKLKKRAERFGQSVSKLVTDMDKLEKRKAKFGITK